MVQPIWQTLISLVELDKKTSSFEKSLQKNEKLIEENQEKLFSLQKTLEKTANNLRAKRKEADLIELKIKELDAQEAEKKKVSDTLKDQKAYKAIKKELTVIDIERKDQEELLVSSWQEVESTEKKLKAEKINIEEQNKKIEEKILESKKENETILEKKQSLLEKRTKITSQLTREWSVKYEKMKKQVSDPIVSTLNSSCSACYYMILPQDLAKIKKGQIIPCRNCYRLLYYSEEKEKESKETVF